MRYLYLHGFASSPASRKARFFVEKLQQRGIHLDALDLAPDFENLTLTNQLSIIDRATAGEPVVLIGSSLGGYLSAIYASQHPQVRRLVLLAPAFDFVELWRKELGPAKLREWRENGSIPVYHYGTGRQTPLGFQFIEDAAGYPAFPNFTQPCLILHGLKDTVVPIAKSTRLAAAHPKNVTLIAVNSGHELTDVLNEIWNTASDFLLNANTG